MNSLDVVRIIKGRINVNLAECARDDRTNHAKAFAMTRVAELRKVLVQMGVRCGEGLQREADEGMSDIKDKEAGDGPS